MTTLPLSFLDLTPVESGRTAQETLRATTELAQRADALGYARYWFAEHHNTTGLASGSPEILIAHIANQTTGIRVGAGGIMLPNHPPLRIAEVFHLLEALHPDRIDLGLGRAPGTDPITTFALRRQEQAMTGDDYPQLLAELLAFEDGDFPDEHPFGKITVTPDDASLPPVWLLGSSAFSSDLAARIGLRFSFAAHINAAAAADALRAYRREFTPSPYLAEPKAMLTVSVVVGETEEQAHQLHQIVKVSMARIVTGQRGKSPTLEEALAHQFSPQEIARMGTMMPTALVGTADVVAEKLRQFAAQCEADEVMVATMLAHPDDRLRTVEQLAAAWGLTPR